MKKLKNIALVILIMASALTINAQEKAFTNNINIGYVNPILNKGYGVSLGMNSCLSITRYVSLEDQVSYAYTKITKAFISGNQAQRHTGLLLVGGRIYFNAPESATRFFINGLAGASMTFAPESLIGSSKNPFFDFALSTGLFIERSKLVAGVSFETPIGIVTKVGYKF